MFKDLFVFEKQRSKKQAFGFYLANLLLVVILGGMVGGITGLLGGDIESAVKSVTYLVFIFCVILSFSILYKKSKLNDFGLLIIALLSGVGVLIGGGALLGLIPAAYLTTKKTA